MAHVTPANPLAPASTSGIAEASASLQPSTPSTQLLPNAEDGKLNADVHGEHVRAADAGSTANGAQSTSGTIDPVNNSITAPLSQSGSSNLTSSSSSHTNGNSQHAAIKAEPAAAHVKAEATDPTSITTKNEAEHQSHITDQAEATITAQTNGKAHKHNDTKVKAATTPAATADTTSSTLPTDAQLSSAITQILETANLETASAKSIRQQLATQFGVDLSSRKAYLSEEITRQFEVKMAEEGEDDAEGDDTISVDQSESDRLMAEELAAEDTRRPRRSAAAEASKKSAKQRSWQDRMDKLKSKRKAAEEAGDDSSAKKPKRPSKPLWYSPVLTDFLGGEELGRGDVVKRLWEYIREHDLQNPKDRREILCDDKLEALFGRKKVTMFNMNKLLSNHLRNLADMVE